MLGGAVTRLLTFFAVAAVLRSISARRTVHVRLSNHASARVRGVAPRAHAEGDCGQHRSSVQQAIDKAYNLQRHRLDRAVAALSQEELASWDTMEGWKLWELYPPIYNCPSKEKLGNQPADGGKFLCGVDSLLQHPNCIVLSFGSNGEPSFEAEILQKTPCTVHTFDPTLDAQKRQQMQHYPDIQLHEVGLGASNAREKIAGLDAEVQTLTSIMEHLRVDWIDLLKIDIEGGEWAISQGMLDYYGNDLPFTQLQIEFHFGHAHSTSAPEVLSILQRLDTAGLRVFSFEYNFLAGSNVPSYLEYSFINVKDCRTLV